MVIKNHLKFLKQNNVDAHDCFSQTGSFGFKLELNAFKLLNLFLYTCEQIKSELDLSDFYENKDTLMDLSER